MDVSAWAARAKWPQPPILMMICSGTFVVAYPWDRAIPYAPRLMGGW